MGDRANIVIQRKRNDTTERVYLYTHWHGTEAPEMLRQALARKARWDDESYLTRIIFDRMTEGQHGEETGFGIWPAIGDNEYPLLIVDVDTQRVYLEAEEGPLGVSMDGYGRGDYSFATYAALPKATWGDTFKAA